MSAKRTSFYNKLVRKPLGACPSISYATACIMACCEVFADCFFFK